MNDSNSFVRWLPGFMVELLVFPFKILGDAKGDWSMRIMAIVMLVFTAVLAAFVLYGFYWLINYVGTSKRVAEGTVVNKTHSSESTSYIDISGVLYPQTTPECWGLIINVGDWSGGISVNRSYWTQVDIGRRVRVQYQRGRLVNTPRLTAIIS